MSVPLLLVDDDLEFRQVLGELLTDEGLEVWFAHDLATARARLAERDFPLVICDLVLPDGKGLALAEACQPETAFIIVTAHASVDSALDAMHAGVFDYLIKPLDFDHFERVLARALERIDNDSDVGREAGPSGAAAPAVSVEPPALERLGSMIGCCPPMRHMFRMVERVAPSTATVLIQGESGTGKELVASAIHALSHRAEGPFIAVNCAAIAEQLIASELFGHERGAFTGALKQHRGYFERATGGTLFLDEITEMPIDLQANLLRVLESGCVMRVGGTEEIPVDVRIIAATNRSPEQAVVDGRLREDLFYRLQVFPVRLPPLRERGQDILLIAENLLARHNATAGTALTFSKAACQCLLAYRWPGNVRELRSAVERASLLAESCVEPEHLMLELAPSTPVESAAPPAAESGIALHVVEKAAILAALEECGGNKRRTAERLGISLKTLYNKLRQYSQDGSTAGMLP